MSTTASSCSIWQAIQASNFRTYRTTRNGRIPDRSGATVVIPKPFDIIRQPWSLYNCVRVALSIAQFAFIVHSTLHLVNKHDADDLDKQVEDNYQDIVRMYNTRIVFWSLAILLAAVNIALSFAKSLKPLADLICRQLNIAYSMDFAIQLVNMYSYYRVHDISVINERYQYIMITCSISFIMLACIINEERYKPAKPVVTNTGRFASGENWASTYSKFTFSWVNEMMKKGNRTTLNDMDLLELPTQNRAKYVVAHYRFQKKSAMVWRLLSSIKKPLCTQLWYCLGWTILMFGPAYFLNKIIQFIEPNTRNEPVPTAYLYVLGLFITSCGQSLCYQQALYIGRTLGIRIQSIVIAEVHSKLLRRPDESRAAEEEDETSHKPKSNVNNLLSVDAQKIGELTAYVFYIYCFPVQISIFIWSLYNLLGHASLWGVLIIYISQPFIYWLSRRFQKFQREAMACTDKRIRLMDELLSAIRIIKFFVWEKQFKDRINDARDTELKAVQSRLYMSMWMGNIWFLIPGLIMVVVLYAYTRESILTASTAFTVLALFNTFKTTLDELPLITSLILQANVSLSRINKFLKEEEVTLPEEDHLSGTSIGFVNDASFSWNKGRSEIPHVRNLNLRFPSNKLSIICGPTGSGKSTLLASLLGETYCLSGSAILPRRSDIVPFEQGGAVSVIAYVAQTAWLQNASIRDNILFGSLFDKERYDNVLYMTALTKDLEILEFGDSTEVGDKGVTLSGGQRQRVAIARAVYSQAKIVILDDCLSAVDAHTAKHLHDFCLLGKYMRDRTVILVTHLVSLCIQSASYVVALERSGSVAAAGIPSEVIESGALGAEISIHGGVDQSNSKDDKEIPEVPNVSDEEVKPSGAGKLVQDEVRAEGDVSLKVYETYYKASGGFFFWISVILLFCLAQAWILAQDYWIKVWSSVYTSFEEGFQITSVPVTSRLGSYSEQISTVLYAFIIPQSLKELVTEIKNRSAVDVSEYLGIYFAIGLLYVSLTTILSLVLFSGSLKASERIHSQLLDHLVRAKVRFFDTTPVGRIINIFSSELETIDQAVVLSLSFLVYSVVAIIYVLVLVSIIIPAVIVPGVFVAYMFKVIAGYYLNSSRDLKRLNSVSRSPIYSHFNETVVGVATIRAFGAQRYLAQENFKRIDANNRPFIWMWATNRWLHCRMDVLGSLVSFCTGAALVIYRNRVNPGLAGLSLSYALTFTRYVIWVVRMYAANEMNMNAIERVREYLDIEEEPVRNIFRSVSECSWPITGMVGIHNFVMKYAEGSPAVLRNISFKTRPGEKVGIVGRTGSGKSTLALSLLRFMDPEEGSITIDDKDIYYYDLDVVRSRLTIIPQDPVLFSGTIRSNLDPFDEYDDAALWGALKQSHLIDSRHEGASVGSNGVSVENISLDSAVTVNGNNWSQGQRQLIALARALVKKTSLIVLDDTTSSVDFDTDRQIQETIREEFKDSTLLCIAHRIRTVAGYDRILVMDQGEVKEFDTPYELISKEGGVFRQMCESSGEFSEIFAIAKEKFEKDNSS
ncbi:hypothetical protein HPULCUR_007743 [Helicostylum pulchrum]|uniref:P-loop containing nucleoside triphosphate hydrolase protein n=1 Tax=Helicostylum pulchrum TaxID=562976 RepID=A0ABP9Y6N4_9FUNG